MTIIDPVRDKPRRSGQGRIVNHPGYEEAAGLTWFNETGLSSFIKPRQDLMSDQI